MLYDLNQLILFGGITHCTNHWDSDYRPGLNACLKLYLPLDGEGQIHLGEQKIILEPDQIYLINGSLISRQSCQHHMDIGWLHFVPASLQLKYIFGTYIQYKQWHYQELPFTREFLHILGKSFFNDPDIAIPKKYDINQQAVRFQIDDATYCQLHSFLVYLIGKILEENSLTHITDELDIFQKLGPAIDFMDHHTNLNPPLNAIAEKVCMAPNAFHRLFKKNFGITPHQYMLAKRMTRARQLLGTTQGTIRQIANQCGYENEFYFSRIFKKQFGLSPSQLRVKLLNT